jgi:transposase
MDRDSLALLLAQNLSVEQIGKRFGKHPSTVSYWMAKYGLEAVNRGKRAARGGIEQARLEALVAAGLTIAGIATELGLSKGTVRHWLTRHGLRTVATRRVETERASRDAGLANVTLSCIYHGETEFVLEGRGYYRCKRCRAERVARRRRKVKQILTADAGGRCCICGYNRCFGALEFHHIDPREKRLQLSSNGVALSLDALRAEARKCVLVCSNCHAEVEAGVATIPVELFRRATMHRNTVNPG